MEICEKVEGLSEQEAKNLVEEEGYKWRVVKRDGKAKEITLEHLFDRVNLNIKDGKVISARIG